MLCHRQTKDGQMAKIMNFVRFSIKSLLLKKILASHIGFITFKSNAVVQMYLFKASQC